MSPYILAISQITLIISLILTLILLNNVPESLTINIFQFSIIIILIVAILTMNKIECPKCRNNIFRRQKSYYIWPQKICWSCNFNLMSIKSTFNKIKVPNHRETISEEKLILIYVFNKPKKKNNTFTSILNSNDNSTYEIEGKTNECTFKLFRNNKKQIIKYDNEYNIGIENGKKLSTSKFSYLSLPNSITIGENLFTHDFKSFKFHRFPFFNILYRNSEPIGSIQFGFKGKRILLKLIDSKYFYESILYGIIFWWFGNFVSSVGTD
jgi:hypothetical protein